MQPTVSKTLIYTWCYTWRHEYANPYLLKRGPVKHTIAHLGTKHLEEHIKIRHGDIDFFI